MNFDYLKVISLKKKKPYENIRLQRTKKRKEEHIFFLTSISYGKNRRKKTVKSAEIISTKKYTFKLNAIMEKMCRHKFFFRTYFVLHNHRTSKKNDKKNFYASEYF